MSSTRSSTPDQSCNEKYNRDHDEGYFDEENKSYSSGSSNQNEHTPKKSYDDDSYNRSAFEIDVCPKKKKFQTPEERKVFVEEYRRKFKTELCKNWELRGSCKFGDKCSFAHGKHQLQSKTALHSKYKTKPCKQYH
jgi:butyrate response factor 1